MRKSVTHTYSWLQMKRHSATRSLNHRRSDYNSYDPWYSNQNLDLYTSIEVNVNIMNILTVAFAPSFLHETGTHPSFPRNKTSHKLKIRDSNLVKVLREVTSPHHSCIPKAIKCTASCGFHRKSSDILWYSKSLCWLRSTTSNSFKLPKNKYSGFILIRNTVNIPINHSIKTSRQ